MCSVHDTHESDTRSFTPPLPPLLPVEMGPSQSCNVKYVPCFLNYLGSCTELLNLYICLLSGGLHTIVLMFKRMAIHVTHEVLFSVFICFILSKDR